MKKAAPGASRARPKLQVVDTDFSFLEGFKKTWDKAAAVPYHFKSIPQELSGSLQENVLALVCMSNKYCRSVQLNVPLELFSNHAMRRIAREAYGYVEAFGKAPREHLPDIMEEVLNGKEDIAPMVLSIVGTVLDAPARGFSESFVAQQLFHFVELQQLKITVAELYKAAEADDVGAAKKAIYDSPLRVGQTLGLNAVTMTVAERLPLLLSGDPANEPLFNLGIPELDRYHLGPRRKTLYNFMAPPKKGKSWWLLFLAKRALLARLKVLYVTLEMPKEQVIDRIIQSQAGLTQYDVDYETTEFQYDNKEKVHALKFVKGKSCSMYSERGREKLKKSFGLDKRKREDFGARMLENLRVGEFPTSTLTLQALEGYLEHLSITESFTPDLLCLDYTDLMSVPRENYRLHLSLLSQQLRGMAGRMNFALATATQTNRMGANRKQDQVIQESDVAEDFSKIAISDVVFTYNQSPAEKIARTARLFVLVARGSRDKFSVNITQSYDTGQFCMDSSIIDHKTYHSMLPEIEDDDDDVRPRRQRKDEFE